MTRDKNPSPTAVGKRVPRKSGARPGAQTTPTTTGFVGLEQRVALIAEAAFFRAEGRGFASGSELEDWLAAETEVDARLLHAATSGARG